MCRLTSQGDLRSHSQTLHLVRPTAQKAVWTSPDEARCVVRAGPHTTDSETETEEGKKMLRPAQCEKLDTERWEAGTDL
jgi:hypothetical protein